ncbi:hypothetical protein ACOMHN_004630 [Nucella lapillus]
MNWTGDTDISPVPAKTPDTPTVHIELDRRYRHITSKTPDTPTVHNELDRRYRYITSKTPDTPTVHNELVSAPLKATLGLAGLGVGPMARPSL